MTVQNACSVHPGYLDLKTLAAYSCCSVRWLRDRFSVSPVFLERLINVRVGVSGKTGNACFCRRDEYGLVAVLGVLPP